MPPVFRAFLVGLIALAACASPSEPTAAEGSSPTAVTADLPAEASSGQPRFFPAGDRLGLSWVEARGDTAVLRFALHDGTGWGAPREAARGTDWFVNWADTPGVVALPTGAGKAGGEAFAAFFLQKTGEGAYHYAVRVVRSGDGGRTWSAPATPHRPDVQAEFGFVSALPEAGGLRLVWLDGEATATQGHHDASGHAHAGAMALRTAVLGPDGTLSGQALLDARTCECCPTSLAETPSGLVAAYRDRSESEVRDIAVVRQRGGTWTAPSVPHPDGWRIEGCPVNGPALAADGNRLALAWWTGEGGGRVRLAFSDDGGQTFGPALRLDSGAPVGRVDVAWADGAAVVSWIEQDGAGAALLVQSVSPQAAAGGGELPAPVRVAEVSAERATGMPRLAVYQGAAWLAWVEPGDSPRVRVETVPLGGAVQQASARAR